MEDNTFNIINDNFNNNININNNNTNNNNNNNNTNINNDNILKKEENINQNIFNYISNKHFQSYNNLTYYIKQFEKYKSDIILNKPNICDVYLKKSYNIPLTKMEHFMGLLNKCRIDKLKLNFTELQLSDKENNIGSGIMYDIDILQDDKLSKLDNFSFGNLISNILNIINNVIDINPYDKNQINIKHYACIIKKTNVEFKENEGKYKDGFHILFPSIQTTKDVKIFIYNELIKSEKIKKIFENIEIKNDLSDIFDKGSYSVPVHFVSNCKINKEPYELYKTFRINYNSKGFDMPESINEQFNNKINYCYEFSLNYENNGGIIKKYYYKARSELIDEIEYINDNTNFNNDYLDENINDISILTLHRPNTKYIRELLYLLSEERCKDRNLWRNVIYTLANEHPSLKSLAIEFSKRNATKWDPMGFEKLWNEAISSNTNNKLSLRSLIYWAKTDSPEEHEKVLNKDVKHIIKSDILKSILQGKLFHYQFAKYLQYMFNEKFITDDMGGKTIWYEFVIGNDKYIKGQIYKWREEPRPDNLYKYISAILPNLLEEIIVEFDNQIKKTLDNDELLAYLIKVKNNIILSTQKLYDTGFKIRLIKEAEVMFRKRGFYKSLNKDQDIMGVGNGILILSEEPKLLTTYHNYPITLYSEIDYELYDDNNPDIQFLEKIIKDLFPDDELDAMEYILYYFASCLDGKPKESMIMILIGNGSNGKSLITELINSVLGEQYCKKMPIQFLIDQRSKSSSADPSLMELETARLAIYSETNKNEELNTAKLKEITGQESISGRNLYEKQKSFRPSTHHIVTSNYAFEMKNVTDHGIWRRINQYEMKMKFCPNPDKNNKYEKKENPDYAKRLSYDVNIKKACLSILVKYYKQLRVKYDGCLKNVPKPTINKETEIFRNKEDIINRFINDRVIISDDNEFIIQELIDSYKSWYYENIDTTEIKTTNSELINKLLNSKINKYKSRKQDGIKMIGIRIIESNELPNRNENEYYLCQEKQKQFEEYLKK